MSPSELFLSFEGRINRAKFWLGVLGLFVGSLIIAILVAFFYLAQDREIDRNFEIVVNVVSVLILIWPTLAVYAKRWHDRGKSGWWSLVLLIPIIGIFWIVIELGCLPGTPGANEYGPDPLERTR